jgi:RimJ/RimL family protein N-acetyltransferase
MQPIGFPVPHWSPRPFPPSVPMIGRFVTLEPLDPARHAAALFNAFAQDTAGHDWTYLSYGPFADLPTFTHFLTTYQSPDDPQFFTLITPDGPRGIAAYLRAAPAAGSIEVGHIHYAPQLQRTAAATEAMYLMMKTIFDLGYRRYEWKCDALNAPSRRAAERLGFTFEGIFRQHVIYKARNRDTAWFSILDTEWPTIRAAFEHWLAPVNFHPNGHQRSPLKIPNRD